jgi:hypothetical protein
MSFNAFLPSNCLQQFPTLDQSQEDEFRAKFVAEARAKIGEWEKENTSCASIPKPSSQDACRKVVHVSERSRWNENFRPSNPFSDHDDDSQCWYGDEEEYVSEDDDSQYWDSDEEEDVEEWYFLEPNSFLDTIYEEDEYDDLKYDVVDYDGVCFAPYGRYGRLVYK